MNSGGPDNPNIEFTVVEYGGYTPTISSYQGTTYQPDFSVEQNVAMIANIGIINEIFVSVLNFFSTLPASSTLPAPGPRSRTRRGEGRLSFFSF